MTRIDAPLPKDFLERYGADLDEALASCRRARGRYLELVRGLDPDEATRAPAPGRWSPADVTEHLVRVERLFAGTLQGAAAGLEPLRMERGVLSAEGRPQAPSAVRPTGAAGSPDELARELERSGEELAAAVDAVRAAGVVERVVVDHAFLGEMDALDVARNCAWHLVHHRKGLERELAAREARAGGG